MRVLAALSGGVDSAVAAARAVDAGHDVVGVHLALAPERAARRAGGRGCCTVADGHDARRAADVLGIPFYVWDLSEEFAEEVVEDFLAEYADGRTPNPCLRCNERIKFAAVLDRALALGFDRVCTGHYARLVLGDGGGAAGDAQVPVPQLHRAADLAKDQSYVLSVLDAEQLSAAMFPLADVTKSQVRQEAAARGLLVADKPDSHDICFIPDGDTAGFLRRRLGPAPGTVHAAGNGEVVGRHDGAYAFTVGQRRGLRLDRPAPDGAPRYVVAVDPAQRSVSVGPAELLDVDRLEADRVRWCGPAPAEADGRRARVVGVQVRAHAPAVPALVRIDGERLHVLLDAPLRGVATGQTVALYDGTHVLGSGRIIRTSRRAEAVDPG